MKDVCGLTTTTLLLLLNGASNANNSSICPFSSHKRVDPYYRARPFRRSTSFVSSICPRMMSSREGWPCCESMACSSAVSLRGGASFVPGQEKLSFGRNLSGSVFSTFAIMYGLACALAPRRTARLFYGYDDGNHTNTAAIGTFLMRLMGSITTGIGLTAAFAIGSELDNLGRLPNPSTLEHAVGIGLIPRMMFTLHILRKGIPLQFRIRRTDVLFSLIESSWFMFAVLTRKLKPSFAIHYEVAMCLLLGPLFFFKPSILYKKYYPPSKHEKLMTKLMASYTIVGGVLLAALHHQTINALPSAGLAALAWVATLVHVTLIRKDIDDCGCSVPAHVAMIVCGTAVAIGCLRHYLVI